MSKRDLVRKILDIKERDSVRSRSGPVPLADLHCKWVKNRQSDGCTPDFYVIRAVTLLEVFARGNIAELIDYDKRFTDRAIESAKQYKIDLALVREIQGRTITLGDILAQNIPLNSFEQFLANFEALLGKPMRPLLEKAVDLWERDIRKSSPGPIIEDFDAMARCLTRLFEVRHILCHEAPQGLVYDTGEINDFLRNAIHFTEALYWILWYEKLGRGPLPMTDMELEALAELKIAEEIMDGLLARIDKRLREHDAAIKSSGLERPESNESFSDRLKDSQEKWLSYRKAQCEFEAYENRGGTIAGWIWSTEAKRLTDSRISELQSWLKQDSER